MKKTIATAFVMIALAGTAFAGWGDFTKALKGLGKKECWSKASKFKLKEDCK